MKLKIKLKRIICFFKGHRKGTVVFPIPGLGDLPVRLCLRCGRNVV